MSAFLATLGASSYLNGYDKDFFLVLERTGTTGSSQPIIRKRGTWVGASNTNFLGRTASFLYHNKVVLSVANSGPTRYILDAKGDLTNGLLLASTFSCSLNNNIYTLTGWGSGTSGSTFYNQGTDGVLGALLTQSGTTELKTSSRKFWCLSATDGSYQVYWSTDNVSSGTIQQFYFSGGTNVTRAAVSYSHTSYGEILAVRASPSGLRALVTHNLGGAQRWSMYSRSTNTWSRMSLTLPSYTNTAGQFPGFGAWSANGTKFAIAGSIPGAAAIFVYNFNSSTNAFTYVGNIPLGMVAGGIDFTPDGKYLAVSGYDVNSTEVYSLYPSGTTFNPTLVYTHGVGAGFSPRFAPWNLP